MLAGTDVSRAIVRESAKDQFELITSESIRSEVRRVLDLSGWAFQQDQALGRKGHRKIDFWLPIGSDGAGCAVIVTSSILHAPDAKRLAELARAVVQAGRGAIRHTILVVNGHLAEPFAAQVSGAFERILTYAITRFDDELAAAIKGLRQRIETVVQENAIDLIKTRIDEIGRQSAVALEYLDAMRDTMVDRMTMRRTLDSTVRLLDLATAMQPRHPVLDRMFDRVLPSIREMNVEVADLLGARLGADRIDNLELASSKPVFFNRREIDGREIMAAGVTELLERCLIIFKGIVIEYATVIEVANNDVAGAGALYDNFLGLVNWLTMSGYWESFMELRDSIERRPYEYSRSGRGKNLADPVDAIPYLVRELQEFTGSIQRDRMPSGGAVAAMVTVRYAGRVAYRDITKDHRSIAFVHPSLNRLFNDLWDRPYGHLVTDFYDDVRHRFELDIDRTGYEPFELTTFGFDDRGRDALAGLSFLDRFVGTFRQAISTCLTVGGKRARLADEICYQFDSTLHNLSTQKRFELPPSLDSRNEMFDRVRSIAPLVQELLRHDY